MWLLFINMVMNFIYPIVKIVAHRVQLSNHSRQFKVSCSLTTTAALTKALHGWEGGMGWGG